MNNKILYDRTGSAFEMDHEVGGSVYVRPMVKVIHEHHAYQDEFSEIIEDFEPSEYLVSRPRNELFDKPPSEEVVAEIAAVNAELKASKSAFEKELRKIKADKTAAETDLRKAKKQLCDWADKHKVMADLGNLLDGKVLYPLTVKKSPYHHGPEIPRIPTTKSAAYLIVSSGNFDQGQPWSCKEHSSDTYGNPFRFFDTEKERHVVIESEFLSACDKFRAQPKFETTSHTTGTTLHYGTLMKWVEYHPTLCIPDDIQQMKAANEADLVAERKAKLEAELSDMEAAQ